MAIQYSFICACILSGATVAFAQILPFSETNANVGNIPLVGPAAVPVVHPDLDHYFVRDLPLQESNFATTLAYPRFNYRYHVADPITGDFKNHEEERDGPNVRGSYALLEPNGSIRHVHYVADLNGFRANVHRTPGAHVPGPGLVQTPVAGVIV
ncbi:unnamed protein product [Allacma fusca]|uniref:Cuticle protein n=1 Tax=Allacma fusca TaxID=39272 RepID=A0A8J2K1L9_9HEXA|nr:unnamed protein product [Allacma fusca]